MTRHLIIPDVQIRPGVDTTHLDWAAQAILEYQPDVIIVIGDFWDMPSLSTHEGPGSKEAEGQRVATDIEAGNDAFEALCAPMEFEMERLKYARKKQWRPRLEFLMGNHEDRISRAIFREPKWDGVLSLASLKTRMFNRNAFLRIVDIDGIKYSHYFPNPYSGRPIGGTIPNRLSHIGGTFVQGHQQGFLYGTKQYPDHVKHGLVCGRFYSHQEHYRPGDVQDVEWNGIVVLNEVRCIKGHGDFDLMPLSYNYLRRKFS
jgi:hypothetical protein